MPLISTNRLRKVSEAVFPSSKNIKQQYEEVAVTTTEVAANSMIQRLLYFNVYYSLLWFFCMIVLNIWKQGTKDYSVATRIVDPLLFALWCVVEPLRLQFGYTGNLQEKVPQLTGFWMFSIIPQLPIIAYHLNPPQFGTPLDRSLAIIMLVFLLAEVTLGFLAIQRIIRQQTVQFRLKDTTRQEGPSSAGVTRRAQV